MVATSIFFIGIIAWNARFASSPPAASASVRARGVICQDRPQRCSLCSSARASSRSLEPPHHRSSCAVFAASVCKFWVRSARRRITPRHIEHIDDKIGVSTRAAVPLRAMPSSAGVKPKAPLLWSENSRHDDHSSPDASTRRSTMTHQRSTSLASACLVMASASCCSR